MALNINGTTGISGVDGSASAPALQGTDSNTGINFASDTVNINTGGSTRATVDSSGNLNIPNDSGKLQLGTGADLQIYHDGSNSYFKNAGTGNIIYLSDDVQFKSDGGGNTGLTINTDGAVEQYFNNSKKCSTTTTGIEVHGSTDNARISFGDAYSNSSIGYVGLNRFAIDSHDGLEVRDVSDSYATRFRIDSSGNVNINNTGGLDAYRLAGSGSSLRGVLMLADGRQANTTNDSQLHTLNRLESDGQLITFSHNGSQEGSISSSGSTISYNGGHLSRWSQLKGVSSTDKSARPIIYQGTVMSNLDDLCQWSHSEVLYKEDVLYTEGDTIPEGKSVGDIKHAKGSVLRAAYTEENQQLNMTKISDTVGDKDVAGVFWAWDDEDDEIVNDFYIAMTGDMVIRVAASTTVARGDLMISAGDGTAKPQDDDIVRSSTIAKIISTTFTATYEDGSKAYPCVLMAC
jgi:hypothetical protein